MPDGRTISTSADRQRRYRQRQRTSTRIVPLEFGEAEAEALIDGGWLRAEDSDDPTSIATAIKKALRVTSIPEPDVLSGPVTEDMEST